MSDAHFIACHSSLCHVFDHAAHLGLHSVVRDEGHSWDTRDTTRLISEVARINHLVARLAGVLSDALGNTTLTLQARIMDHPRFERLEMSEE